MPWLVSTYVLILKGLTNIFCKLTGVICEPTNDETGESYFFQGY